LADDRGEDAYTGDVVPGYEKVQGRACHFSVADVLDFVSGGYAEVYAFSQNMN
jgi:hypothetical protein